MIILHLKIMYVDPGKTILGLHCHAILTNKNMYKTLLFDKNEPWVKRGDSPMFDVAMGCYDGAEVCELVGLYILHKLSSKFPKGDIGLYRDDDLAKFKNMNARAGDKARKDFSKVIGDLGLKITVQSNLKVVDYLDVTLNLTAGKYCPFWKPDNDPLYINAKPNHPLFPQLGKFQHP